VAREKAKRREAVRARQEVGATESAEAQAEEKGRAAPVPVAAEAEVAAAAGAEGIDVAEVAAAAQAEGDEARAEDGGARQEEVAGGTLEEEKAVAVALEVTFRARLPWIFLPSRRPVARLRRASKH